MSRGNCQTEPSTGSGDSITVNSTGGTSVLNGAISGAGNINFAVGAIDLNNTVATSSATGTITFSSAVTLGADTTVTGSGGNITFSNTIDGAHALTVAQSTGNTTFSGAVGGSTALTSLNVSGSGAITLAKNVTTTGTQNYTGAITLTGNDTLTTTNSNVTFGSTVDGAKALTIGAGSGTVTYTGAVGGSSALTSVSDSGSGTTVIDSNITTTGAQSYSGPVTLGGDAVLTTTNSNVTFSSTVDGARSLTVSDGTATTTFVSTIGATTPLVNLTLTDDAVSFGGNIYGTGTLTLKPSTNSVIMNINNGGSTGLYINSTEQGYFQNDWAGLVFGKTTQTSSLKVGASTWVSPLTLIDGSAITISGVQTLGSNNFTMETNALPTISSTVTTTGNITIETAGNTLGIGTSATGTVNISDAALGDLSGGSYTFGDTTNTSALDFNYTTAFSKPMKLLSAGNVTLNSQVSDSAAGGSGTVVTIAATGNFINNSGDGTSTINLTGATSPLWYVYSTQASSDTNGASAMSPMTSVYSTTYPTTTGANGNTWFYSSGGPVNLGTITITASRQTVTYGTAPNTSAILNTTYACSGSGSACSDISGSPALSISGSVTTSSSGNYNAGTWTNDILSALGTLAFNSGYTGSFSFVDGTLSVLAKSLSITGVTANNKTYDGTTTATLNTGSAALSGKVIGDTVSLGTAGAIGTFASPNVANGIAVNTSGFTISGADAVDYTLTQPTTTANITPAALTITASNVSGSYGTSAANTLNGSTGFTASGLQNGETIGSVTLSTNATTSTSGNDNAGTWTITPSNPNGGTLNPSNYSITYDTGTQTISKATLTVSGMTASNKSYDGTTNATVNNSGDSLSGVVAGLNNGGGTSDVVSLTGTGGTSGSFSQPNVGNSLTVTGSGLGISGADASNYTLSAQPTATANITPAALTITANSQTQTYGAGNNLTQGYTVSGLQNGETVGSVALASTDANAHESTSGNWDSGAWTITPSNAAGGTFNPGNYSITYNVGTLAVNPRPLTVSASAQDKTYDGTANVTVTLSDNRIPGDALTDSDTSASFSDANVGTGKTVTVTGIAVGGTNVA